MRRARPLLGTIVDIQARGADRKTERAVEAGFAAIAQVQRLMSFHESGSDISRLNREAWHETVKVHPWTWRVLQAAQEFSRRSDGVFDITIAPELAGWNYLPGLTGRIDEAANGHDIVLSKDARVHFRRRLVIDLGGIAKGFAVDRAVTAMQRSGASGGVVNAGGDVRVFGENPTMLRLRHPIDRLGCVGVINLRGRALATSALSFTRRQRDGVRVSPLIDGRTRRPLTGSFSVTVAASTCTVADALTKIVFALGSSAVSLLAAYGAEALLVERSGKARWLTETHAT